MWKASSVDERAVVLQDEATARTSTRDPRRLS